MMNCCVRSVLCMTRSWSSVEVVVVAPAERQHHARANYRPADARPVKSEFVVRTKEEEQGACQPANGHAAARIRSGVKDASQACLCPAKLASGALAPKFGN